MRVLQLISSAGCYGAEIMLANLAQSLERAGCRTVVGVFRNSDTPHTEIADYARECGLQVELIPCHGRADRRVAGLIRECMQRERIDILHTHGYKADIYGYMAATRIGQPLIATCHNWTRENFIVQLYGVLDRWILRRFPKVVAVSETVAAWLRRDGVPTDKISIIGNGIDVAAFGKAEPAYAREIRKGKRVAVGLVGRLVLEKGPQFLLAAAQQILRSSPETLFVFVGDGPARQELEQLARTLGIENSVIFAGQRSDMPSVYASLDIVVLPSLREAMPMSIMEAMAAGKPVIASRLGAVPELVFEGKTGFLIDAGAVDQLKNGLTQLLSDARLRQELGAKGQVRAIADFSSETMARSYLGLYEQLVCQWRQAA